MCSLIFCRECHISYQREQNGLLTGRIEAQHRTVDICAVGLVSVSHHYTASCFLHVLILSLFHLGRNQNLDTI